MDLLSFLLICGVIFVMAAIVFFCFRVGQASVLGRLNKADVALRFYREYMQKKNSNSYEAIEGFLRRIEEARGSMHKRDYDFLLMAAGGLVDKLKKQSDMEVSASIHRIR